MAKILELRKTTGEQVARLQADGTVDRKLMETIIRAPPRLQGRGPHTAGGHGRNRHGHVGWQEQQETELRGPARNLN